MFIYSLRAGTVKMIGVLCVALTVLITLIAFVPGYVADPDATVGLPAASYSYDKIRSAEEAAAFLSQFSWQVEATPVEIRTVTVTGLYKDGVLGK